MNSIQISCSLDGLTPNNLDCFHQDWRHPMTGELLLKMLHGSECVFVAWSDGEVVGYLATIGDGCMFAFISSVEVREEYRSKGVGSALVQRAIEHYQFRYALDLLCDKNLEPFYEKFGFQRCSGMALRNFPN